MEVCAPEATPEMAPINCQWGNAISRRRHPQFAKFGDSEPKHLTLVHTNRRKHVGNMRTVNGIHSSKIGEIQIVSVYINLRKRGMGQAKDTVLKFIGEWKAGKEAHHEAYRRFFRDDTVWENHGWRTTVGSNEAIELLKSAEAAGVEAEIRHICEEGNIVFTERLDHIFDENRTLITSIRVVGVFEIKDDKICMWREYFDTKLWDKAMDK